jgi:hypothetical protein
MSTTAIATGFALASAGVGVATGDWVEALVIFCLTSAGVIGGIWLNNASGLTPGRGRLPAAIKRLSLAFIAGGVACLAQK